MSQLMSKKQVYTNEVHLSKEDPGYGTPLEGNISRCKVTMDKIHP